MTVFHLISYYLVVGLDSRSGVGVGMSSYSGMGKKVIGPFAKAGFHLRPSPNPGPCAWFGDWSLKMSTPVDRDQSEWEILRAHIVRFKTQTLESTA